MNCYQSWQNIKAQMKKVISNFKLFKNFILQNNDAIFFKEKQSFLIYNIALKNGKGKKNLSKKK